MHRDDNLLSAEVLQVPAGKFMPEAKEMAGAQVLSDRGVVTTRLPAAESGCATSDDKTV